jgi:long-chain acyl-CoA synthetase
VGEIDPEGFLRITDRKKDLIVTSGGKKVAPQMIENLLKADPLVSQAMVLGDRSSHLVALITLDQDKIFELRERERLEFANLEEAVSYPRVISIIGERIRQMNKGLAPFEAVRGFRLLPQDFTLGTGELTPTLKLKRQVVMERHSGIIEEMTRKPRVEI